MAIDGFERADGKVSVHEGGYSNHPNDPGGATMKGVIQRVYDSYRKAKGLATRTVKKMTEAERLDIYRTRYWNVIHGDDLPPGIDYAVYDGAVNSGPAQSVKWLQRALGSAYTGKVDGLVGPETLRALETIHNHDNVVARIAELRLNFLKALKTWPTFKNGWSNRVAEVKAVGQAWARGDVGPEVTYVEGGDAKALIEDAKSPPNKEVATGAATGGAATGGVAVAVERLQETITPYSMAGTAWIDTLVVILAVISAILVIGGLAWRFWQARKAAEINEALGLDSKGRGEV
jgi:lysozyme family protein